MADEPRDLAGRTRADRAEDLAHAAASECGTEVTYRRHLANGEDCETCRTEHNERARRDDKKRARSRAQSRALKALARCFPIEYQALYLQELAKEADRG